MKVLLFLLAILVFGATGWSTREVVLGYRAGKMPMLFSRRSDAAVMRDGNDNFRFVTTTVLNVLVILVTLLTGSLMLYTTMIF